MPLKKISWKSMTMIIPNCCIPKIAFVESKKHVPKFTSFQKLFVDKDLSFSLSINSNIHIFTLNELKVITQNFSPGNLIGEGGFGPVYKGLIDEKFRPGLVSQSVAVKSLDLEGLQGHKEWLAEIFFLGQHGHENLIKLIGCCCEDTRKFLVYEYMPKGSLENHLFRRYSAALSWSIRMKIALGAAKGLASLHEAEHPVIYRDFKASNILLDSDYSAKLSDFGLAKDGPKGKETHVSASIMGTQGYAAPEYLITGHLTSMSDVYSFGVVLLELITGNRAMDRTRAIQDQSLVNWARPLLKDRRKIDRVIDPRLEGHYSTKGAQEVAALAYKCLSCGPRARPRMSEVVNVLEQVQDFNRPFVGPFVYVASDGIEKDGKSMQGLAQDLHYIKTINGLNIVD